ncbi:MAG: chitobiase/beta-hexosaminidase C-terminal domain-containing protein [Akkermansiaceae bacterium]|nr:chitobiase/beta-hexosaminidase C-terminal domain-containing protein [Akkermansiaceae bacterium]
MKNFLTIFMGIRFGHQYALLLICGFVTQVTCLQAVTSVTYKGITWNFSADRTTGTFANGEPWVIGPVTITGITPNPTQSVDGVQHGSMVNPTPNAAQGFDSHPSITPSISYQPSLNVALSLPFTLKVNDVLVSANSQWVYPTYLKTICALTVLGSAPPAGSFRPSIFGTDRTVRWNISQLNWGVLQTYPSVPSTPSKSTIQSQVPPLPWFEWANIWSGNSLQPVDNTADGDKQYGRETAMKFGQVGLWLNTNQPLADKQPIAIQMVQNGLDIYAYVQNGGGFYHDGGHKCGRKLPLVLAALMLNDTALKSMAENPDIFQEDTQTFTVTQADVGRVVNMDYPGYVTSTYVQQDVGIAEWGVRHRWEPFWDNRTWNTGYRSVVGPGMMGPWLAAYLMGAQNVWNHPPAFGYMARYHSIAGDGTTFTAEMYAAYKQNAVPPPTSNAVVTPIIVPASGSFDTPQAVSISTPTLSATIRYTLNGNTPGTSDIAYTGPISIASTTTIKAIASAAGLTTSAVAQADIAIGAGLPVFNPVPSAYGAPQMVALSSSTVGSTIRFTSDGTDPTTTSSIYTGPISVPINTTIKAFAQKSGIASSAVASGSYLIGAVVGSPVWNSVNFTPKSIPFTYGFDMVASGNNIDAVIGLGGISPVAAYSDLACIVRFNSSGRIDVRNAGAYTSAIDYPYAPGVIYSLRLSVDPISKTYGVTVSANGSIPVVLAQNFQFRTEQANLATFNNMALIATAGSQTVTNHGVVEVRPSAPKGLRVIGQ